MGNGSPSVPGAAGLGVLCSPAKWVPGRAPWWVGPLLLRPPFCREPLETSSPSPSAPAPPPPGGGEEKQGLEKEAGTIHRCAWPCSRQTQGSCPLTGHTLQDRMQQIGTSGGDKLLEKISGTRDRGGNGTPGCHTDGRGGVSRTLWPLARREIDGFTVVCRVEGGCWWQRLTWGEDENVNG